ncbi:hypothetical protein BZA03_10927 [Alteromonas sp. I10]|nr:hypothetical protein [Rhodospirillaceae bacterium]PXW71101.1 hypothetical protein BZA03_10927 [Alteromonas sp. I10]|tara:strand:+ start:640 stop:864 length:225 start_codon:yes stop_codon:yes gene_type:complete
MVAQATQDVFVIWRRKKHFDFDFQLISKTGELSKGKPYLKGYWKAAGLPVVSSTQISDLDHDKLHESLVAHNYH